jgi:oxalate decarboxylase/phosphoglucose isomerase-like protein (cupin superfamily)
VPSKLIDPAALPTMSFDWGVIKPLVSGHSPNASLMHVVLLPGQGHERHNHPDADEILYVLAGEGEQMVDDAQTFGVRPGHTVWIPKGAFHSTRNTSWEPLALLAIYAPAGAEEALKTLPDYREVAAGDAPPLIRPSRGTGSLSPG